MKRAIFLSFVTLLSVVGLSAQNYSGLLTNIDGMTVGDMANYSYTQFQYGTARSMAMGGAISSLGADVSSMSTNPAGLGVYQRSEFSVTPLFTKQKSESNASGYGKNSSSTPSLGNLSFVMTMPYGKSKRGLLSMTFGVGYNRIADLNYNVSYYNSAQGRESSIGQFFSTQLNDNNISASQYSGENSPYWGDVDPNLWGAALGYKVGLADQNSTSGEWSPAWIADGARVVQYLDVLSEGSIGEYNVSMAANISNKIYVGVSLGIMRLRQEISYNYSEFYDYSTDDNNVTSADYAIQEMGYNQTAIVSGAGVNFKIGVIYRPIEPLRLSFAVHTPTAYSINREYQAAASSAVRVNTSTPESGITTDKNGYAYFESITDILEDYNDNGWCFSSPTRLLFGASYLLGNRALISVDYQRDCYGGVEMTSVPSGVYINYNSQVERYLKGVNTLRVGGEFKVSPAVSLRAGYGFSSTMVNDEGVVYTPSSPIIESLYFCSVGVGFVVSKRFSVDFAYMYNKSSYTDFILYEVDNTALYSLDVVRHNIAMTTSFKF